ncbi:MAG: GHKL domain-containing protein [Eubacterium sp.]|nr:GHKL domain-containing protein [Eubacterium sp.]
MHSETAYTIDFKISYNAALSFLIISCKNPLDHGFGLENIAAIADKWRGFVHYDQSENSFAIMVSLQNLNNNIPGK